MFSIISAAMPCVFGGSSYTVHPRYVVEIGSTHSGWYSFRSAAVIVPPFSRGDREDRLGRLAFVEAGGAFLGDEPQRAGEVGILEDFAGLRRAAVGQEGLRRSSDPPPACAWRPFHAFAMTSVTGNPSSA